MQIDIFNNEERVLLNGICKNESLSSLTKEDVLNSLLFSRQIANEDDTMITDLIDSTSFKVKNMTEDEWNELKMKVPFPVALLAEDEVSEVPTDEN